SGSAARFFYCAKSSKRERNAGMPEGEVNIHPTCKPLSLLDYLCRLSRTPTGGVVLDPFMGSGTTGVACVRTGRNFIGIEKELDYFNISAKRIEAERIEKEKKQPKLFSIADERHNVA
ncbi:MAG: site-specific DNA-methyltransferase, partial [Chloroflexi bacterium]|nr:site-specific DNA-methyltransferase [Chloroflexota bacterium]